MNRLGAIAAAAALAAACTSAEPAPVDPAEALALANDLVSDGQVDLAASLLERSQLASSEEGRPLMAEIALARGRYDEVFSLLAGVEVLSRQERQVRLDACAVGALDAFASGDDALASRRMAPCEASERIDLAVLRAMRTVRAGDPWTERDARTLVEALREGAEGPARDRAAAELEALLLQLSETTEDPVAAVNWRRRAFDVAQSPQIGADLAQRTYDVAEQVMATRPQDAATLLERLYLRQVQGLTVSSEMVERARGAAEIALFPVFLDHYRARFARKWRDGDIEAGVYDPESDTFTHPPVADAQGRRNMQSWIYSRIERPVPDPLPSFVEQQGHCDASQDACTFTLEELATMAYRASDLEQQYAAEQGLTLQY